MPFTTGTIKEKLVKNGRLTTPVRILLVILFVIVLAINPVTKIVKTQLNEYAVRRMAEQFFTYQLPEKTDKIEGIYYVMGDSKDVSLFVKSDLTREELEDYYRNFNCIFTENSGDEVVLVIGPNKDIADGLLIFESLGNSCGAIQKFDSVSSYKDNYILIIQG